MTIEKPLYQKTTVSAVSGTTQTPKSKEYRGFSTVASTTGSFSLYDIELIKQDIVNHFNIRQGEKLENADFGTIIWDCLFEPLTPDIQDAIVQDVTKIVNYDPRVKADQIIVTQYESGIQIQCVLLYLPYNISEQLQFKFDQANGLI